MGQQWERSLFCQFQLLGSHWEVHWLKLTPGLNRVLGGKTTPPNIFFRPILPKFEEIFEIVVGDFERWPMLPVRKTPLPVEPENTCPCAPGFVHLVVCTWLVTLSVQVIQREASVATESSISEKRSISVVKRGARNINSFQEIPATSFNCAAQVDKYRQNT